MRAVKLATILMSTALTLVGLHRRPAAGQRRRFEQHQRVGFHSP